MRIQHSLSKRNWGTQPACLHHDDHEEEEEEDDDNDEDYHHDHYFHVKDNIEGVDACFIDDEIEDHVIKLKWLIVIMTIMKS